MVNKGNKKEKLSQGGIDLGLGGILKGLGDLVEKLGELAESGEQISKTGEIRGSGQEVKGIYGFTVKVGLGDDKPRVEPFGNIRRDAKSGNTVVQEVREPVVDVLEEEDHVLVLAEMPGIGADSRADRGARRSADYYGGAGRQEVPQGGASAGALRPGEDADHLQ